MVIIKIMGGLASQLHKYAIARSLSLKNNTEGRCNTAVGNLSLCSNTTGNSNTAVGSAALFCNTVGIRNTALGASALCLNTGDCTITAMLKDNNNIKQDIKITIRFIYIVLWKSIVCIR
jgi:hypothetical protein